MKRVLLAVRNEETVSHLALKLLGLCLFSESDPIVEPNPRHSALVNLEFAPDLLCADEGGEASVWIECGNTSPGKLAKMGKRLNARIVILVETPEDGERLRLAANDEGIPSSRVSILAFPKGEFPRWRDALEQATCVVGEADEKNINLVVNSEIFSLQMVTIK
ncbi:MAG: hypothetical protein WCS77_09005 [Elusimicrobiaceae bacterium]|jgi:hypothetical protein